MRIKLALAILLLIPGLAAAQDKLADQLRKAIVEEEGNQNLDKAIQAYKNILAQFDEERRTAATALFHMADCYRKQGRKDEAVASYQRVVQEFADQPKLVDASRSYLTKSYGMGANPSGTAAVNPDSLAARQRYRDSLLMEIKLVESQIQSGERRIETGVASQEDLIPRKRELLQLQRELAAFDGDFPVPSQSLPVPQADKKEAVAVDGKVMEARLLKKVAPVCPEVAVRARMEGTVRLSVAIGETGLVTSVKVIGGGYPPLQPAAADAVKQWRYSPYVDATGRAVPVITTVLLPIKCPGAP